MSEHQPDGAPDLQPYSPHPHPPKNRPSVLWFALGGVLLVLGTMIGVVVIATSLGRVTQADGVITADGRLAAISAPPNRKRMLFVESGHAPPNCTLVDGTGQQLLKRTIVDNTTLTSGGRVWRAFSQIDSSGDGSISLTCTPVTGDVAQVRMGEPIDLTSVGGAVLAGFGALLVLGGAGLVILLATGILWFTRRPAPA